MTMALLAAEPVPAPKLDIRHLDVNTVGVSPARFQFKGNVNPETGASTKLAGGIKYDPLLGGVLYAWEDRNGKVWIVNGHHRLDLAKRSGYPTVSAIVDREADGVTEADARSRGALINIAEGQGTPIDVAKFLRDSGQSVEWLRSRDIAPSNKLVERGAALAQLDDGLFYKVITGQLTEDAGVVIGAGLPGDYANQRAVANLVSGTKKELTPRELKALIQEAKGQTVKVQQINLFGETTEEKSTMIARAKVRAWIEDELAQDKKLFRFVTKAGRPEQLARGETVVNIEKGQELARQSGTALEIFNAKVNAVGPINDIVREAAEEVVKGGNERAARENALRQIREAISTGVAIGDGSGPDRVGAEASASRVSTEATPAPTSEPIEVEAKTIPIRPRDIRGGDRYFTTECGYITVEKVFPFDERFPASQQIETNRGRRDIGGVDRILYVERVVSPSPGSVSDANAISPSIAKGPTVQVGFGGDMGTGQVARGAAERAPMAQAPLTEIAVSESERIAQTRQHVPTHPVRSVNLKVGERFQEGDKWLTVTAVRPVDPNFPDRYSVVTDDGVRELGQNKIMRVRSDPAPITSGLATRITTLANALDVADGLTSIQYIRWDRPGMQPGDVLSPSRRWEEGELTDTTLPGSSVINPREDFDLGSLLSSYAGIPYVVEGEVIGTGQDQGEVILKNARIVRELGAKPSAFERPVKAWDDKQPWQMTKAEYLAAAERRLGGPFLPPGSGWGTEAQFKVQAAVAHRGFVEAAIEEGKSVPSAIMAEYPDLTSVATSTEEATPKEPWQMTRAEFQIAEYTPMVEAIHKAIREGKPIALRTHYRITPLRKPEHIYVDKRGDVRILSGRKSVALLDDQVRSLAAQAGMLTPTFEERIYHRAAVEEAVAAGKPVPAEVLRDYPDIAPATQAESTKVPSEIVVANPPPGGWTEADKVPALPPRSRHQLLTNSSIKQGETLTNESGKKFSWVQTLGYVAAKPASELRTGDVVVWNHGDTGKVIGVKVVSPKFLEVETEYAATDGETRTGSRRYAVTRLVPVTAASLSVGTPIAPVETSKQREERVFRETEAKFAEEAASTETISEREERRATEAKPPPTETFDVNVARNPRPAPLAVTVTGPRLRLSAREIEGVGKSARLSEEVAARLELFKAAERDFRGSRRAIEARRKVRLD